MNNYKILIVTFFCSIFYLNLNCSNNNPVYSPCNSSNNQDPNCYSYNMNANETISAISAWTCVRSTTDQKKLNEFPYNAAKVSVPYSDTYNYFDGQSLYIPNTGGTILFSVPLSQGSQYINSNTISTMDLSSLISNINANFASETPNIVTIKYTLSMVSGSNFYNLNVSAYLGQDNSTPIYTKDFQPILSKISIPQADYNLLTSQKVTMYDVKQKTKNHETFYDVNLPFPALPSSSAALANSTTNPNSAIPTYFLFLFNTNQLNSYQNVLINFNSVDTGSILGKAYVAKFQFYPYKNSSLKKSKKNIKAKKVVKAAPGSTTVTPA